ncbi:hypothetical protein [Clostridium perfringens]|uniref:hypothetical protein n=1 Tax=Clostridium perfringens TaxID=1502 RepID=UPI001B8363CA|nr:hypothetical protein [Clostridium perfringens]HBC2034837.1 hypothetical protein [Clostridium perfringens]HBC2057985.1 hypothetical protein [Clostridium perfringens]HBC2072188.1 hypothetical protein [Clostridium perfringens]
MSYKDGLEIILPTFLRIRKAIDHNYNSIVLIANNSITAEYYLKNIEAILKKTGDMKKVEKISICRNTGDISVAEKNKDNTLIILCGQWYKNKMFFRSGVLEAISRLLSESLSEIPYKVFNRSTGEVESISSWYGDKTNG